MSETVRLCKLSLYANESCMRFIVRRWLKWLAMLTTFRWKQFKKIIRPSIKKGMKNVYQRNSFSVERHFVAKAKSSKATVNLNSRKLSNREKVLKTTKKSTNKAFWSHFKHFGRSDCWEKFICLSDKFGWGLAVANKYHKQAADNKSPQTPWIVFFLACEQALLFGRAKRASRERASGGPRKGELSSAPRGFAARSRVLARLASVAQIGERHCLHFSSLEYDLTHRSRGRIYELNAKVERADKVGQFVQFSALCEQYWRKYQPSKIAKLLCGKKVNEPYILCKISSF